jgi:hypothetical protein
MSAIHSEGVGRPVGARRLSRDLEELLERAGGRSLTFSELQEILGGRGFALFILLLSLPFSSPVTIPGLSVPFGVVILGMGLRIAVGRKPELPRFILRRQLKYSILNAIVLVGLGLCRRTEAFVRPRWEFLQSGPGMRNLIGIGVASGGFLLCLPFPPIIPFSNTVPALGVVFLAAGMIERDGVLVLMGYAASVLAWVYLTWMVLMVGGGIQKMLGWFA